MRMFRKSSAAGFVLLILSICCISYTASAAETWIGTWATGQQLTETSNNPPSPGLANNTLRQVVHATLGGSRIRVHFSNKYSSGAVTINSAHIAVSTSGSAIDTATDTALAFGGSSSVTISAGQEVYSDAIDFTVTPLSNLAVSIYFGTASSTSVTGHPGSRTTSYIQTGNAVSTASLPSATTTEHWYILSRIDLWLDDSYGCVVTLGDSITDGRGSTTNGNNRWPDNLASRLHADPDTVKVGVINQGIGGNCVVSGGLGPTALARFDHDVTGQPGVRWVIILEGVNDIGGNQTAANLIAAYQQFIDKAHAANILAYGVPILPFGGSSYDSTAHRTVRQTVNSWIRTSGEFDAVIDLDAAVRDTADPEKLLAAYDSGDHLHLNVAGYQQMANAINLDLFLQAANPPGQASNPSPSNGATNVGTTTDLSWTAGSGAASHDVYFGTSSPGTFRGNQTGTTYDTGTMSNGTTYYWRIDEKNAYGTTTGAVWSFTTTGGGGSSVSLLGTWVTGTSHTRESGTDRALIFIAHGELTSTMNLSAVTYGGQSMTKVVEYNYSGASGYAYAAAFILKETGVAAASSSTFTTTWSGTAPSASAYTSVFLGNVNQTTATGATGTGGSTSNPVTTSALATSAGDMVLLAATCGNAGSYTLNNSFIEGSDQQFGSTATGVTGRKSATGANETPSATYSSTINRHMIIGFVVKAGVSTPTPPGQASSPTPSNGATSVGTTTDLSWTAGSGATSHDVYFGTTSPGTLQGNQTGTTFDTGTMSNSTTYYWRIDEKNAYGTTTGTVWSFTTAAAGTPPGAASGPSPSNGATSVGITTDLSWTAGSGATSHDVYFGTASTPPLVSSSQTGTTYDTGTMSNSTTYYWRIDEKNAYGTTTGTVWSFTTAAAGSSVSLLGSWVTGTSHTKESGSSRALIFIAHAESTSTINLSAVSYGGQAMTKVVDYSYNGASGYAYAAAFILKETGVAAASTSTFSVTWGGTAPGAAGYSSVFLGNVNQTTATGATGSGGRTSNPVTTSALATASGDMVILGATCGNSGSYTLNNSFIEGSDQQISGTVTGVTGRKSATGANETPSATYSSTINRQMIIGLVVKCQ